MWMLQTFLQLKRANLGGDGVKKGEDGNENYSKKNSETLLRKGEGLRQAQRKRKKNKNSEERPTSPSLKELTTKGRGFSG